MTSVSNGSDEDIPEFTLVVDNGRDSVLEASSSVSPVPPEDGPTRIDTDTLSTQKEPSNVNVTGMGMLNGESRVGEIYDSGAHTESSSQETSSQPKHIDPNGLVNASVGEVTSSSLGRQQNAAVRNGQGALQEGSGDVLKEQSEDAQHSSIAEESNSRVPVEVVSNSEIPVPESVLTPHSDATAERQASQDNCTAASDPIEVVSTEDQGSSNLDRSPGESNLDASNLDTGVRVRPTGSQTSDLPVLQPLSPTHDSDLNEQYDYLRRTLSHSRRRYSTRRRNNHSSHSASVRQSRHTEGSLQRNPEPRDLDLAQSEVHQTKQRQTIGHLRNILRNSDIGTRPSAPSEMETHVDQHGRTYYMDHSTRTLAFDRSSTTVHGREPEMRARREMLERRYQSLQRSFRRRNARGIPSRNQPLSPILSPDNMSLSLTREEAEALSRRTSDAAANQPIPKPKKQRTSKSTRWLSFGRRSNKHVSQVASSSEDAILPISPREVTPAFEDSVFSTPATVDVVLTSESDVRGIESSVGERTGSTETPGVEQNERGGSVPRVGITEAEMDAEEPIPRGRSDDQQSREDDEHHSGSDDTTEGATRLVEAIVAYSEIESQQGRVPSVAELGRQHSIVRTTEMSETVRAAALKARHRVRATTVGSTVRKAKKSERQEPLTEEEARTDTDEETNEAVATPRLSPTAEPSSLMEKQEEAAAIEKKEEEIKQERSISPALASSPALKFITRKDLYSFLNSTGEPGEEFIGNRPLMELVQRIRANKLLFEKYQHSRHLVSSLNKFADVHADLPEGWEKKLNKQGKVFFMDHINELTTFIDPRLPLPDKKFAYTTSNQSVPITRRVTSADEPAVRPHHTTVTHSQSAPPAPTLSVSVVPDLTDQLSYDDQVVAFFRQADIEAQIGRRYQRGVRPPFREVIESIRLNGAPALERIQMSGGVSAYELALVLSLFEDEISHIRPQPVQPEEPPLPQPSTAAIAIDVSENLGISTLQRKKQAFSTKLQNFKMMLARLGFAQGSRLKFNIRRDHLLEDAYEHMMKSDCRHLQKKRLTICFRGEEGLDYGGPSREFFFLLSREIFNPYYGLFEYSANDTYTVGISPTSCFIQNNREWFRFAGRLIGLVIAQGFLLDVFFTRTVYKSLIDKSSMLQDLESLEPAFYNSLIWIQDNDPEPLDLTFTVEEEAFGQLTTHELKPGGTDIPVTEANKQEYIQLMIHWRLDRGVAEQLESLKKGFNEVMSVRLLELQGFDAGELEFLIAGTLEIDIDDWKANTEYRNGYHPEHPVVQWFWQAVEMFDNEQRLRLLQFVTGTSSVPFEGFKALRGSTGPKKFTIDFFSDIRSLPRTHTCFNRIDLPPYPSFEILFEKLRIAVEEGSTFGIE